MAKKATTIILLFVVLLLLGSTVYISIILTTDTDDTTLTQDTRASETEDDLEVADSENEIPPIEDPFLQDQNDDTLTDGLESPAGIEDPPPPPGFEEQFGTDEVSNDLAYANPTPVEDGNGGPLDDSTVIAEDTEEDAELGDGFPFNQTPEDELPETGLGTTISPTPSPRDSMGKGGIINDKNTPPPAQPTMPVAGAFTTGLIATVVAGATIIAAFIL